MQDIVTLKAIVPTEDFDVPNCPRFNKGQKVRIKETLADELVSRKLAKYDIEKPMKTKKSKDVVKKVKASK